MDDAQVPILPTDEDNAEERQEKVARDEDRPFSPPGDIKDTVADDNEMFDSQDVDSHQAYDEGKSNAAEVKDKGNRGIAGYNPPGYQPPQNGPVQTRDDDKP